MNKKDAIRHVIFEAQARTSTKTSAKRTYRALRTLGFYVIECYEIMRGPLEFDDQQMREIPDLAALPELSNVEASKNG